MAFSQDEIGLQFCVQQKEIIIKRINTKQRLSTLITKAWDEQKNGFDHLNKRMERGKQHRKNLLFKQYLNCIEDLITSITVQRLSQFLQHGDSDRLQHSLSVSYYTFVMAKRLGLDYRSAARGALLHDLFFYYSQERKGNGWHVTAHPREALANATAAFELNEIEQEMILCHMFPFCAKFPRHAETHVISLVDKVCATQEAVSYAAHRCGNWKRMLSTRVKKAVSRG